MTPDLGHRFGSLRRWCLQAVLCFLVLLGGRGGARAEPANLFWGVPAAARVLRWSGHDRDVLASARFVDPELPVHLEGGEWLVLPARPGARFRVTGAELLVGWGSGRGVLPDVVTWQELDATGELLVPSYSSAQFLVLGRSRPGAVGVRVALPERDALRWHRFDAEVASWLDDGRTEVPVSPAPELEPTLRWLGALRHSFGKGDGPPRDARATSAWLMQRWLGEALRQRPLLAPYFARATVSVQGGRPLEVPGGFGGAALGTPVAEGPWTEIQPGERVTLQARDADVVRITLQTRTAERVHLHLFEGEQLLRELVLPETPSGSAASPMGVRTSTLRAVVPVGNPRVSVLVVQGHASLAVRGYVQRTDLFDGLTGRRRSRRHQLGLVLRGDVERDAIAALAALDAERSELALARVERLGDGVRGPAALAVASEILAARPPGAQSVAPFARLLARGVRTPHQEALLRRVLETWVHAGLPASLAGDEWRAPVQSSRAAEASSPERPVGAGEDEDGAVNEALLELLWPEPASSDRSPALAWRAEAGQVASGSARGVRWARLLWQRGAPWTRLPLQPDTPAVTLWEEPLAPGPGITTCPVRSAGGITRWRLLAGSSSLRFEAPAGHYARALFTAPDAAAMVGGSLGAPGAPSTQAPSVPTDPVVFLDGVPFTVHGRAGLVAAVGVAPGEYPVRVEGAGPVLARLPGAGEAPCSSLRERVDWAVTDPEARYRLEVGSAALPIRVQFRPGTLRDGETDEVSVRVGAGTLRASVRAPGTGVVEGVLRGHPGDLASELVVATRAPRSVRVSARLRPRTVNPQDAASPAEPARVYVPPPQDSAAARAERDKALERFEQAERLAGEERRRAREHALRELGFWRLADLERSAGPAQGPDGGAEAVDPHTVVVFGARPRLVPLGWTPTLPPLAASRVPTAFERLRVAGGPRRPRGGSAGPPPPLVGPPVGAPGGGGGGGAPGRARRRRLCRAPRKRRSRVARGRYFATRPRGRRPT